MRAPGGISAYGRKKINESILSIWQLFFTTQILDLIVECTNDKAKWENVNFVTNRIEILKFIGVLILIGVYK